MSDEVGEVEVIEAVERLSAALLAEWRDGRGSSRDHDVLREKLLECGWRYERRGRGRWYHPEAPEHPAPKTLTALARAIAARVVEKEIEERAAGG